jgi:uncharacterized protein YuzE
MRKLRHQLNITSTTPPSIEFDPAAGAVYVRFLRRAVKRTIERASEGLVVTIDLDQSDRVVGIEAVGFDNFSISSLLRKANVRAENIDFSRARMRATPPVAERDLVPA